MTDLAAVLDAFKAATRCEVAVWADAGSPAGLMWEAATNRVPPPTRLPSVAEGPVPLHTEDGAALIAALPGPRKAWMILGPCTDPSVRLETQLEFLLPIVSRFLLAALEVEHAANELAERYEEINLLYTISEILGRTVALEEGAQRILTEISETVGARKAVMLVHDATTRQLNAVAALGVPLENVAAIAVDDDASVSARVFRNSHPLIVEPDQMIWDGEQAFRKGARCSRCPSCGRPRAEARNH